MSLFRYARNRGSERKAGSGWFYSQLVDSLDQAVRTSSAAELGPEWGREPGLQAEHRVQAGLRGPLGARSSPEGAALAGPPVCLETLSSVYRPEAPGLCPAGGRLPWDQGSWPPSPATAPQARLGRRRAGCPQGGAEGTRVPPGSRLVAWPPFWGQRLTRGTRPFDVTGLSAPGWTAGDASSSGPRGPAPPPRPQTSLLAGPRGPQ